MEEILSGWLAPSGELIKCGYYSHLSCASNIVEENDDFAQEFNRWCGKNEDSFILSKGYCKIGINGVFLPFTVEYEPLNITKEQDSWFLKYSDQFTEEQKKDITEALERIEQFRNRGVL